MRKQPERTAKTKQALRDSFWNLYSEKPIEKITVKEITDGAGVYRSTFYEYYADVYSILEEIEQDIMRSYDSFVVKFPEIHSLTDGLQSLIDFYSQNAKYMAILLGSHGDPAFPTVLKAKIKSALQIIMPKAPDPLYADVLIEVTSSIAISLLNYWHEHREVMSIPDLISVSSKFIMYGLVPYFKELGLEIE